MANCAGEMIYNLVTSLGMITRTAHSTVVKYLALWLGSARVREGNVFIIYYSTSSLFLLDICETLNTITQEDDDLIYWKIIIFYCRNIFSMFRPVDVVNM